METEHQQNSTEQQQQSYDSLMEQNQRTYIEKQKTQTQNVQESQVFSFINPYDDIEPSANSISTALSPVNLRPTRIWNQP